MMPDAEQLIKDAIVAVLAEPKSRGASLALTKLDEALMWLRAARTPSDR